ncbi:hypothetical protein [Alkaliphilus sp. B6464]|nr:hypothetical protein [Alkaliphilus sp. B6464]QUH18925.1 hypothetical protein HYG84_02925 [Alkaliphilus sp. B6464]
MAAYIAKKIMLGRQDYTKVFSISIYKRYQDEADAILVAEGRVDLIVRM